MTAKATDSDLIGDHDELGTFDFMVDSLHWVGVATGDPEIYFRVSVRKMSQKDIHLADGTSDPHNPEQWYWFENRYR